MIIARLALALTLQAAPSEADVALGACLRATAPGQAAAESREALNGTAERLWRAEMARDTASVAARTGLARVLVQCRMALAGGPADMMGLFQEGVSLLEEALARDPRFWPARFTLGMVYARAPEFLDRTADAIVQLEMAIAPDGIPAGRPERVEALTVLARMYERGGRRGGGPAGDSAVEMAGLTVRASAPAIDPERNRGGHVVTALDIVTMPGGTADLMQVLQVLPGVTGGSESSDLSLRGGDPYEAPVFLNGARLAYAGKFESLSGSLFGVLDPDVLRSARVHAGGFSARYGDALSGVIEAEAIGRPAARSRRYGLNSAGPAATLMQPLGGDAGAWASARFTHTGVLLWMQGRGDDYTSQPISVEGIGGYTRRVRGAELRAVGLLEHDAASPNITIAGHSGAYRSAGTTAATVLSARLDRVGPLSGVRVSGTMSARASQTAFGVLDISRRLRRGGVRAEGDALLGGRTMVTVGVEASRIAETMEGTAPASAQFAPGSAVRTLDAPPRHGDHAGAFAEAVIAATRWLTVRPGIRADRLPGERGVTVDPRALAEATFGRYGVSVAAGVFQQGSFRPTRELPGLDERLGVARRARHLVVGLERRGAVTLRGDAYLKRYDRYVDGDSLLQPASGTVVGGDVFLNIPGQRRSGHVTYSAMRGRLTQRSGARIPTAYDVTHSLVAAFAQRLTAAWEVGMTLRLATGRPYTALLSQDTAGGAPAIALGAPNASRFPAYRRVDARVSRYTRAGSRLIVSFAELLNLEGRKNVVGYGVQNAQGRAEPIGTFYGQRTVIVGVEVR